ncbi:MAG TPA: carboxymuconolactone decarboxylase family protein [Bacillus sp. (in: firmicutes)]|nr:carboxymuconolactone decarboxylase family protein [Bacillus sp. (in: firmicutes)]
MESQSLYKSDYIKRLGEFQSLSPDAYRALMAFDQQALAPGALSAKQKELIAVAIAHITGCPYCIDIHVNKMKEKGGNKREMVEAIMVATALKAGSALAHGVNALYSYDRNYDDGELYQQEYFARLKELSEVNHGLFMAFIDFDKKTMKAGALTVLEKELIAVAAAHTTGCPYCIDLHTRAAKGAGASKEHIAEVIFIAAALKAGSAFAHGVNAFNTFDD